VCSRRRSRRARRTTCRFSSLMWAPLMATSSADRDRIAAAGERRWFRDLQQGTGDATHLDDEVRRVLELATVDIAADLTLAESLVLDAAERERAAAERENERRVTEERVRRDSVERAARLERATDFDHLVIVWWFWFSVTLIGPWLVGFFLLKDGPLLARASGVFDTQ